MNEETRKVLGDRIRWNLEDLQNFEIGSVEREKLQKETVELLKQLHDADQLIFEYADKEDRRKIEREKIESTEKTESEKRKLDWKRCGVDIGKGLLLLAVQIAAYSWFQKRSFDFETNGHLSTWTARELHLPKFMK